MQVVEIAAKKEEVLRNILIQPSLAYHLDLDRDSSCTPDTRERYPARVPGQGRCTGGG